MLVKKEMLSVPTLPAPKGKWQDKYIPAAQIVELPKSGRILAVDYYDKKELHARFFCDGKNYAVYSPKKATWGSGYPTSGSCGYYVSEVARVAETDSVCNSFFDARRGVDEVNSFIYQRNSQKRQTTFDNMIFLMKQHMKMFPDYPENLRSYCEDHVFQNGYIFFGKKEKKAGRKAVCSHCGAEFSINTSVVSGKETTCPVCRWKSVYRANWIKADVTDKEDICISYKVDNQLLLRWAHVERSYCYPELKRSMKITDFAYSLYLVVNGKPKIYTYKYFKAPYAWVAEWHRLPLDCTCDSSSYIYTDNLDDVFGSNYYNVHLKAGLEGKHLKLQFVHLLDGLKNDPKAEYLFKLGLPSWAASSRYIPDNPDGKGVFEKTTGISKQFLPMYKTMNVSYEEHLIIKSCGAWVSQEDMLAFRSLKIETYDGRDLAKNALKTMSFGKFVRYFGKQMRITKKSAKFLMIQHRDYLDMAKDMKIDLSRKAVRFPTNVCYAHDAVLKEFNRKKFEAEDAVFIEAVAPIYERLAVKEFENEKYCIVLPQLRTDLIAEGTTLRHCVGGNGYCENHMNGTKMIFFVRKKEKPEIPYFTMQIDMQRCRIIQIHGAGNCNPPKEVMEFANRFVLALRQADENKKGRKTA